MEPFAIPLSTGQFALIDSSDWERPLSTEFRDGYIWRGRPCDAVWHPHPKPHTTYVVSSLWPNNSAKQRELRLNRLIVGAVAGEIVDHWDHDGLNNCCGNLRVTNASGNARNRLPSRGRRYKGVRFHSLTGKYEAYIRYETRKIHLGLFVREEDGAAAYNEAALRLFGEFALLNEIGEEARLCG